MTGTARHHLCIRGGGGAGADGARASVPLVGKVNAAQKLPQGPGRCRSSSGNALPPVRPGELRPSRVSGPAGAPDGALRSAFANRSSPPVPTPPSSQLPRGADCRACGGGGRPWLTRVTQAGPCTSREVLHMGPAGSWGNPVPFRPFPRPRPSWGMALECRGRCGRVPAARAPRPTKAGCGAGAEAPIQGRVARPGGAQARETRRSNRRQRSNPGRGVPTAAGCQFLKPKSELEPN